VFPCEADPAVDVDVSRATKYSARGSGGGDDGTVAVGTLLTLSFDASSTAAACPSTSISMSAQRWFDGLEFADGSGPIDAGVGVVHAHLRQRSAAPTCSAATEHACGNEHGVENLSPRPAAPSGRAGASVKSTRAKTV